MAVLASAPAAAADNVLPLLPLSLDELIATPVTTASRRAEARERTPAHIMVITREQMRDRRYKNLADLLEDLPGVDFQRGTRSTQYNHFVFQGHVSNNKLLILLDGVRIDHPAGGKIPVAENFSLYFAKQVEVLYGPAAALYGADAFAGVINIITQKAADQPAGKVALGGGSFGSLEGDFLVSGKLGKAINITAGAHYQKSDRAELDEYYRDDFPKVAIGTTSPNDREDYIGNISSQSQYVRLDAGERLTLGFYRNRFRSLTSTGDRTSQARYAENAFWDTTIDTWHGRYRLNISSSLTSETIVDFSRYEVSPNSSYLNIFTDPAEVRKHGYDYSYGRRAGIEQNLTWQANDAHNLQAGIGYRNFHAIETPDLPRPYRRSLEPDDQGMFYANTNNSLPLQIFEARYHSWAGYLQWNAQWLPELSTVVGVRHDWYSTYGGSTNPRVGVVWQPAPGNFLKLLYGEAFRAPSPDESYSSFGTFSGTPYNGKGFRAPNPDLEPEKSRNLSLTWDWRPTRKLNLLTNAYLAKVSKVITTQSANSNTLCPFDPTLSLGEYQYIPGATLCDSTAKKNSGNDRYHGIDIIPQWQIHLGGPWSADLWGSYSYVKGWYRETDDGPQLKQINIAAHKVKLGVTLRYQDWLTITPRLQWIDDTTTGAANRIANDRIKKTDAYTVASLHIGAHKLAGERLSVYFDIYNLFDRRYYAAHTSSSSAVMQAVPQQPRTFMGTLEYRF